MSTKVLIAGGGIGGLCLAHGLKKHNIPFHVFEKDRTECYRAQGYRIRVGGTAVAALQYLLDEETYADFELSCADLRMADIPDIDAETGKVDEPKVDEQTREILRHVPKAWCIDRSAFREVLIKRLSSEDITYDKVFERYEKTCQGVIAHFNDGSTASGTLLVGAEGKSSRVRKQLVPQLEVNDTGVRCIYGKTPLTAELLQNLDPPAGERMSFVKDRSHDAISIGGFEPILFPHRSELETRGLSCPPDYLFWVLTGPPAALRLNEDYKHLTSEESEQKALEISSQWCPQLRTIIEHQQKGESSAFSITAVEDLAAWDSDQHVTLIGDAVHPMAPTGSGAVLAMTDAHVLCRKLAEMGQSKDAILSYEEEMRATASKAVKQSWTVIRGMALMTKSNERHIGEMAMQIRAKNIGSQS
jgi:2-polyprenyl-6-methoxyphenol hydroxylase-like FAD-dependent oxidoreductase